MSTNPKKDDRVATEKRKRDTINLAEEYDIFLLMSQVVAGMVKARENELKPTGLTPMQVGLMYVVKTAARPLTISQISRRLVRQRPSVHQLFDRMKKQGLVKRIRTAEGGQERHVLLTKKGEEAYLKLPQRQVIPRILGQLSPAERKQLNVILEKLRVEIYTQLAPRPLAQGSRKNIFAEVWAN